MHRNIRVIVIIFVVAVINLLAVKPLWNYYHTERSDYKVATTYLLNHLENNDIIFHNYSYKFDIEGLLYYMCKFGNQSIFIAPRSLGYFQYPPYIFEPLDKRDILKPVYGKKGALMLYTGDKDINTIIDKIPKGRRFWVISDKKKEEVLNKGIDKVESFQTNQTFRITLYHISL